LRPATGARARLLRLAADRPAHVAGHGGPAGDPLLPRLRADLPDPERAHDRPRERRHVRYQPATRGAGAGARPAGRAGGEPLQPPLAPGAPGGPAAARGADGRGRGGDLGDPRRQGVRPRGPHARPLPARGGPRLRPEHLLDAPAGVLLADAELPAQPRPRGGATGGRARGDPRHALARPVHRLLHVPHDADGADADAGDGARDGPAGGGLGEPAVRDHGPRAAGREPAGGAAAAARAGGGRAAGRVTRLRRRRPLARGREPEGAGRAHGRPRRAQRLRQDQPRGADRAPLRPQPRPGARRWRRRARGRPGLPALAGRVRRRRQLPVLGNGGREHRLRASRRHARGDRARRPPGAGPQLHLAPAARLRDPGRRARDDALGRAAPADRDRAGAPGGAPHPDPRRRHVLGGRAHGGGDQARPPRGDGRAHDLHRRPPPLDDLARRRDRRHGRRADRGLGHARRAGRALPALRGDRRARPRRPRLPAEGPRGARGAGAAMRLLPIGRANHRRPAEVPPEADPATQGSQVAEAAEVEGNQPGRLLGTVLLARDLWRLARGDGGRGRKLRWMLRLLRPYRGRVALMFVALLVATAAGLAPPYLAGKAIDEGIVPHDMGARGLVVAAFLVSAALYWAASFTQTYLVGWVGQRALQDLRERIYVHLQAMSIGFFTRNRPGVLISRLTNDVSALDSLVTDGVVTLFSSTLTLLGVVVILIALDPALAL